MGKLFLFYIIWRITGNPILAVMVLLILFYIADRRYLGLLPSVVNPFRKQLRISRLKKQIDINQHDMNAKYALAQAYMEGKSPHYALELLRSLPASMQETAEVLCDIGLCHLQLNAMATGENLVLQAFGKKSNLRYGEPYMALGAAFSKTNPAKALHYYKQFHTIQYSSCVCHYRMGQLYQRLSNPTAAKQEWSNCVETYRSLPKFRKRHERRWVLAARLKLLI